MKNLDFKENMSFRTWKAFLKTKKMAFQNSILQSFQMPF